MLETMSADDFLPHVNSEFELADVKGQTVELVSVEKKENIPGQEMFSLIFAIASENQIAQSTFKMKHPILGEGELFLVPIAEVAGRIHYEAAFNRVLQKG